MTEYAYRASEAFEDALRARGAEMIEWDRTVLGAFHDAHPATRPLWRRGAPSAPGDRDLVGFEDSHRDAAPPDGLSRNRERKALMPKRGAEGAYWRGLMRELAARPRFDVVYRAHDVATFVMVVDGARHRLCTPALVLTPGVLGIYLRYSGAPPPATPHLSPIKVSQWYAALEAADEFAAAQSSVVSGG